MNTRLNDEFDELKCEMLEVKDEWHDKCQSQCLGPVVDHIRDEVIDLTERMDEVKEEMGEPIEIEY